jgi:hypothetical protein
MSNRVFRKLCHAVVGHEPSGQRDRQLCSGLLEDNDFGFTELEGAFYSRWAGRTHAAGSVLPRVRGRVSIFCCRKCCMQWLFTLLDFRWLEASLPGLIFFSPRLVEFPYALLRAGDGHGLGAGIGRSFVVAATAATAAGRSMFGAFLNQ